jgi:hypothetical protein
MAESVDLSTLWVKVVPDVSACKQATVDTLTELLSGHVYMGDTIRLCREQAVDLLNRYVILPKVQDGKALTLKADYTDGAGI